MKSFEHTTPSWHSSELSHGYADYVRERLSDTPGFGQALAKLAEGLGQEPTSSRMLLRLPIGMTSGPDTARAMVAAAKDLTDIVQAGAFEDATVGNTPYVLVEDNSLLSGDLGVPDGAKTYMPPNALVGYVRVERDATNAIQASVGAFDPQNQKHDFLPL